MKFNDGNKTKKKQVKNSLNTIKLYKMPETSKQYGYKIIEKCLIIFHEIPTLRSE